MLVFQYLLLVACEHAYQEHKRDLFAIVAKSSLLLVVCYLHSQSDTGRVASCGDDFEKHAANNTPKPTPQTLRTPTQAVYNPDVGIQEWTDASVDELEDTAVAMPQNHTPRTARPPKSATTLSETTSPERAAIAIETDIMRDDPIIQPPSTSLGDDDATNWKNGLVRIFCHSSVDEETGLVTLSDRAQRLHDALLEKFGRPTIAYHGSSYANVNSILTNGFNPRAVTFFSSNQQVADAYAVGHDGRIIQAEIFRFEMCASDFGHLTVSHQQLIFPKKVIIPKPADVPVFSSSINGALEWGADLIAPPPPRLTRGEPSRLGGALGQPLDAPPLPRP